MLRYFIFLSFLSPYICAAYSGPGNVVDCTPVVMSNDGTILTCSKTTLTLIADIECNNNSTLDSFKWFKGNIDLGMDNIDTITVNSPDLYRLVAYFDSVDSLIYTIQITENKIPPSVSISPISPTICVPSLGTVTLIASATPASTFQWDNGPATPDYLVEQQGVYSVTATASINGCTATADITVVGINPTANPTASPSSSGCIGSTISLIAGNSSGTTVVWKDGNTTIGNGTSLNYNISTVGPKTLTVEVSQGNCKISDTIVITGISNPVVTTSIQPAFPCQNDDVTICAMPEGNQFTYSWLGGGISGVGSCVTTTLANTGVYTFNVTVTDTSTGCKSTDDLMVTPKPLPFVDATVEFPFYCEGASIKLSTLFNASYTYSWSGPAGFNSNVRNPVLPAATIANGGNYEVTVTNAGCTFSDNVMVNIQSDPKVVISAPAICIGDDITLSVNIISPSPNNIIPVNYSWSSPTFPGLLPKLQTISVGPITAGTSFGVEVTFPSNLGCDNALANTFINPNLSADYKIIGDTIICANQWVIYSTDLDPVLAPLGNINWSILPNSNFDSIHLTSNASVIALRFKAGTSHTLGSTHAIGSCISDAKDITISHSVNGTATSSADIYYYTLNNIHIVMDSTADCYQWGYYDPVSNLLVDIPGANYQAYAPGADFRENRTYWVKTWNGPCETPICPNLSFMIREAEWTGFYTEPVYSVFPNPTNGVFTISAEGIPKGIYMLRIVDMLGRLVEMQEIDASPGLFDVQVQMQESAAGVYKILLSNPYGIISVFSLVKF